MPSPACWPRTITARSSTRSRRTTSPISAGRLTVHLAREFGFCYGVDRAVDYAYQTRERFPDRRVFLTGEIIHNPHVNDKLRAMGIRFLSDEAEQLDALSADDVVILPAFGVTVAMLRAARSARLHAHRHHLRLGPQRLEERPPLRRGRLHVDHPRQGLARGNAGDRVAGGAVRRHATSSSSTDAETEVVCDYIRQRRRPRRVPEAVRKRRLARLRSRPRPAAHRPRQPDDDADVASRSRSAR